MVKKDIGKELKIDYMNNRLYLCEQLLNQSIQEKVKRYLKD
jgi:hypothetical protein